MKFGAVPLPEAQGAILAHSFKAEGELLRKGQRLTKADITALEKAGQAMVTVAI